MNTETNTSPPPFPRQSLWRCGAKFGLFGCLFTGVALFAVVVVSIGRGAREQKFGRGNWAEEIRHTLHITPPKLDGGRVLCSGLREDIRTICVYGDPVEIRKLVDRENMKPDLLKREMSYEFPPTVADKMKREDFAGVVPWHREWPDSDPKGHTITDIWIHPKETSAVIVFWSSTN